MDNRRAKEVFRRERRLYREILRKKEQYETLAEEAASTGSFRYDQDKVIGSSPDGSRQERIVMNYLELAEEIAGLEAEHERLVGWIQKMIGQLPPRERRIMKERHLDHAEVEEIMERFGITYETYRTYHKRAIQRLQKIIDSIPKT